MHAYKTKVPMTGILCSIKRLFLLISLTGLCCGAYGQDPETLKASADQQLESANVARNAGRYGSAIEAYAQARDLYKTIAENAPEWNRSSVQKKLFYCRQQISLLEEDQELREGDDLNSILDMIEREGLAADNEDVAQDEEAVATLMVQETEIMDVDTSEGETSNTAAMLEELEMSRLENRRFGSVPSGQDDGEELKTLKKQLERTQKVVESLQTENHDMTKRLVELDQVKKELAAHRRKNGVSGEKKVFRKQEQPSPKVDASAKKELKKLQKQLAAAQKASSKSDKERADMREELEALQNQVGNERSLKKELARAAKKLKSSAKKEQELSAEIERLRQMSGRTMNAWDAPVPVEGGGASVASESSGSKTAKALEKKVAKLESENREASQQIAALEAELSKPVKREPSRADRKRVALLEKSNRKLGAELKRTRDLLKNAERQLTATQDNRVALETAVESADSKWSAELLKTKQALNREMTARLELEETVRALRSGLKQARGKNEELLLTMQERAVTSEVTGADMKALEREWQGKLKRAQQDVSRYKREVEALNQDLQKTSGKRDGLDARFEALQDEYLQLANSSTVTASENVTLKKQYEYAVNEVEQVRADNEALLHKAERLEDVILQAEQLRSQLKEKAAEVVRLQQENSELGMVEDQMFATEKQMDQLRSQLQNEVDNGAALQKRLQQAGAQLERIRALESQAEISVLEKAEWSQAQQQLQIKIDDLMSEKLDSEVALARLVSERDNAEKMIEKVKADYTALATKHDRLAAELTANRRSVGTQEKELQQEVRQLQNQLSVRTQQLDEMKQSEQMVQKLRQELAVAEQKKHELVKDTQRELILQKSKSEQLVSQMQELQERAVRAEKDVEMLKAAVSQTQKEKGALEARIDQINNAHHKDLLAAKKNLAVEKDLTAPLQDQILVLNKKIEEMGNTALAYEKKLIESEKLKDALESEIIESDEAWRLKLAETMKELQTNEEQSRKATDLLNRAQADNEIYQQKIEDLTVTMAQQESQLKQVSGERQELQKQLALQSNRATQLEAQSDDEVVRMQELVSELQEQVKDSEILRVSLRDKERLLERREGELKQAKDQLARMEEAKKQWNASNDDIRKQWSEIKTQVDGLNDQLRDEQKAKGSLQAKLDKAEEQIAVLKNGQDELSAAQDRLTKLNRKLKMVEKESELFKQKLAQAELASASLGKKEDALREKNNEIKQLKQDVAKLATVGEAKQALEEELQGVRTQLNEVSQELANVRKSNELNVKLVARQQDDLNSAEKLGSQMEQVSREKKTLLSQLQDVQKEREALLSEKQQLAEQQQTLNAQVAKQSEMIKSLNEQVKSARGSGETLASAKQAWEKERQTLKMKLEESQTLAATMDAKKEELSSGLKKQQDVREELQREVAQVTAEKTGLEKRVKELEAARDAETKERDESGVAMRALQKQLAAAQKEKDVLEKEKNRMERLMGDARAKEMKFSEKQAVASNEIDAAEKEIRELKKSHKDLAEQLARKESELAQWEKKLSVAREDSSSAVGKIQKRLDALEEEKETMAKTFAQQQSEMKTTAKEMKRMVKAKKADAKALESLQQKLAATEKRFDEKTLEAEKALQTVAALEDSMESVKEDLDQAASENQNLNARVKSLSQELKQATDTLESLANY